jgi:EpsI family protein
LTGLNGKQDEVGDYIISNGPSRAEVLYWYQSHGRTIASDYKAKLYMLTDSIRYDRSDAALVRVVVPLFKDESPAQAHARAVAFASQLLPLLPAYIPD